MISLIWAMDNNNLIGIDDRIPWHVKEDLLYYKSKTKGQIVLMGDVTYYSLKGYYKTKPLPYGKIYVATLNDSLELDDAIIVKDIDSFFKSNEEDLWVVGGSTIYKLALPYADRLYISFIKGEYTGNRYFPTFDINEFNLIWEENTEKVRYTLFERK